ncbi:MAG: PEP-CTERM sorting domain-containing protein [Methylophilaceae bacterium]
MMVMDCRVCVLIFAALFSSAAFADFQSNYTAAFFGINFADYTVEVSKAETFDSRLQLGTGSITFSGLSGANLNVGGSLLGPVTQVRPSYNFPSLGGSLVVRGNGQLGLARIILPAAAYSSVIPTTMQLASSVPEPSAYVLMLSGLLLIGLKRKNNGS